MGVNSEDSENDQGFAEKATVAQTPDEDPRATEDSAGNGDS